MAKRKKKFTRERKLLKPLSTLEIKKEIAWYLAEIYKHCYERNLDFSKVTPKSNKVKFEYLADCKWSKRWRISFNFSSGKSFPKYLEDVEIFGFFARDVERRSQDRRIPDNILRKDLSHLKKERAIVILRELKDNFDDLLSHAKRTKESRHKKVVTSLLLEFAELTGDTIDYSKKINVKELEEVVRLLKNAKETADEFFFEHRGF